MHGFIDNGYWTHKNMIYGLLNTRLWPHSKIGEIDLYNKLHFTELHIRTYIINIRILLIYCTYVWSDRVCINIYMSILIYWDSATIVFKTKWTFRPWGLLIMNATKTPYHFINIHMYTVHTYVSTEVCRHTCVVYSHLE